jgi:hypothetical protein
VLIVYTLHVRSCHCLSSKSFSQGAAAAARVQMSVPDSFARAKRAATEAAAAAAPQQQAAAAYGNTAQQQQQQYSRDRDAAAREASAKRARTAEAVSTECTKLPLCLLIGS